MARRVLVHIGLPKTATTYLQTILWGHREVLADQGLLLPGAERRDHLWSSRVVREDPHLARAPERHRTAWQRLVDELGGWPGTGLVSHEFFAAASREQAARMVADLAPATVELVVTAREPLGLFTASWQESLKNRHTTPIEDYAREVSESSTAIWNWRTLDLRLVLERWAPAVASPDHVHVLPVSSRSPREDIWHRFAAVAGIAPDSVDTSGSFPNESMGVVEAEALRRINRHLGSFRRAFDRGVYIRTHLADERLVPRGGDKFWPPPDRITEQRARGEEWVSFVREGGFDVRGDLAALLVPAELEERREPASVTDAEVADVTAWLVARMLEDVRAERRARNREPATEPQGVTRRRPWRWRSRRGGR